MSEQVVDFLEPIQIETQHSEALPRRQCRDLLVYPRIEMTAVGKRREGIVMRQEIDVLLGVLARLQIANSDNVVRPSGKNDLAQDQFNRGHRAVDMAQIRFNSLVRPGKQLGACDLVRKTALEPGTNEIGCR